jgi:hypothetical protein
MRPGPECLGRKTFSPGFIGGTAQLFTVGSGQRLGALLADGRITVGTVSGRHGRKGSDEHEDKDEEKSLRNCESIRWVL